MSIEDRVVELEREVSMLKRRISKGAPMTTVFVDLRGAAKVFSLSESHLRYLCNTGQLRDCAFKRGRKWLLHVRKMEERLCRLT